MLLGKIKKVRADISQMKKIGELIDYISVQGLEKLAFLILILWVLTPIIVLIPRIFTDNPYQSFLFFMQETIWSTMLQQLGLLGCIVGVITFTKSIRQAKVNNNHFKQYIIQNIFPLFLFLMLVWSVLSFMASDNRILSYYGTENRMEGIKTYVAYCGIFSSGYVIRKTVLVQRLLTFFTGTATVLSILIVLNIETVNKMLDLTPNAAVFYNINHFGYYICVAIMCALLLFMVEKKSTPKLLFRLVIFAIMIAALVINKSFGPYLAVVVGLGCMMILIIWLNRLNVRRVLVAVAVFIVVSVGASLSDQHLFNDIWILGEDVSNILEDSEDRASAGSGRWPLWETGIRFITEKPWFGYGPDNLGEKYIEAGLKSDRPHNELIQFAASLGIPAMLFYILALVVHFSCYFKKRKQLSIAMMGILCAVITYLVSSMFGNTMYYTSPFFFMILGLSGGMLKSIEKEKYI